jgi:hypothetical protein
VGLDTSYFVLEVTNIAHAVVVRANEEDKDL